MGASKTPPAISGGLPHMLRMFRPTSRNGAGNNSKCHKSDALPFGGVWYDASNAVGNAFCIRLAKDERDIGQILSLTPRVIIKLKKLRKKIRQVEKRLREGQKK